MTPDRKLELEEYPPAWDELAENSNPRNLAERCALKDAAFVLREALKEIDYQWGQRDETVRL